MATRFRRKDLKRPDAFVSTTQRGIQWAMTHQRKLYFAAGAAVLGLIGIGGMTALSAARTRQANEELGAALATFRAEKYAEAAAQLRTVANSWGSTSAGKIARLYAADAELAAGNPDLAVTDLQGTLADPPPADYLTQQAALNLGYALEQKQDLAGAAESYSKAAGAAGPYRALALLREARVSEKLGDNKRAEQAYETFIRDFAKAPEVELAEARLRGL